MADLVAVMHDGRAAAAGRPGRPLRPPGQPVRRPLLRLAADERARRRRPGRRRSRAPQGAVPARDAAQPRAGQARIPARARGHGRRPATPRTRSPARCTWSSRSATRRWSRSRSATSSSTSAPPPGSTRRSAAPVGVLPDRTPPAPVRRRTPAPRSPRRRQGGCQQRTGEHPAPIQSDRPQSKRGALHERPTSSERSSRSYTRRQIVNGAVGTGAALGLAPLAGRPAAAAASSARRRRVQRRGRRLDHDRQRSPTPRWCRSATSS